MKQYKTQAEARNAAIHQAWRRGMASNRQSHSRQHQIPPVLKWPLITLYLILATALITAVIKLAE